MYKLSNKTPSPIRHQARFILDSSSFSKGYNEYNGLKDPYLEGFFASERRKKLLLAQNLINQKGKINDGMCKKKILDISLSKLTKKKSMKTHSTNGSTSVTKRTFKKEENEVQPMSSEQFKKLIEDFRKQNGIETNKHLFITNHE